MIKFFNVVLLWLFFIFNSAFTAPMDIPLLSKLSAPLKAELDISEFTNQIMKLFNKEMDSLKQDMRKAIDQGLKQAEIGLAVTNNASVLKTITRYLKSRGKSPGCQSGIQTLTYSSSPMAGRRASYNIKFNPPFPETPALTHGFMQHDISNSANLRVHGDVLNLSRDGFTLNIFSWGDTKSFNTFVSWMACPKHFWVP